MDAGSDEDPLWAILVNRRMSVGLLMVAAAAIRPPLATCRDGAEMTAVAVFGVSASAMFAVASAKSLVSAVSVPASLYPVVVSALARAMLGELVLRIQQAGAAAALVGVVLISAG